MKVKALLAALLVAATFLALFRVIGAEYVILDDGQYVVENPMVNQGLSVDGLRAAFTSLTAANWHPLTWISLMLDTQVFGGQAWGHHLVNLLLHLAGTALLFLVLVEMTGSPGPSALVAALFGVHPAHVESVAWISERKDVLSMVFWTLTMGAYCRYVRRPSLIRYLPVLALFALGLMAKPMLVTLPLVLLLLDYWPFARFGVRPAPARVEGPTRIPSTLPTVLVEKIPLLVLSAAASFVTLAAQSKGGALGLMTTPHLSAQLIGAVKAYAWYLKKFFLPIELSVFYPISREWLTADWRFWAGAAVLAVLTAASLFSARRTPFFFTGWFWYCGTLVPVIGLVRVGAQSVADRYTYIPYIGLFLAVAWGLRAADLNYQWPRRIRTTVQLAVLLVAGCLTFRQAGYWHDSGALFRHATEVTENNAGASFSLGLSLLNEYRYPEAAQAFQAAIQAAPGYADAHFNLGLACMGQRRLAAAATAFREAARLAPQNALAHYYLGVCAAALGDRATAMSELAVVARQNPQKAGELRRIVTNRFR